MRHRTHLFERASRRRTATVLACVLAATAYTACDDEDDLLIPDAGPRPRDAAPAPDGALAPDGAVPDGAVPDGAVPDGAVPSALGEAEVATIEAVLHDTAIGGAELALERAIRTEVRDYAEDVYEEHLEALEELNEIIAGAELPVAETPLSEQLRLQGVVGLGELAAVIDPAFDQAYLAAQIELDQTALVLLQTRLIPNVRNEGFRNHLVELFNLMRGHLTAAQELLVELPGGGGPTEG